MSASAIDWDATYRSGRYRQFWELSRPAPELVGFLAGWDRELCGDLAVLDVGCGTGRDALLMAQSGCQVHAVDVSPTAVELTERLAAECGCRVSARVGDVTALPYLDATFDLVTDRGCLHHLSGHLRQRYAEQVGRVLKTGGVLFVRGCRRAIFPFTEITAAELTRYFVPAFEVARILPVTMETDAEPIDGNACMLRRVPSTSTPDARESAPIS
jgi:SAM-dependent methyltransferase